MRWRSTSRFPSPDWARIGLANTNHSYLESRRPSQRASSMYVCLCNEITDSQLVEAALESPAGPGGSRSSAERVADRLGAGLGCGTCRTFAVELVERAAEQSAVVLPARVREPAGFDAAPDSSDHGALRVSPARNRDARGDLRAERPT